MCKIEKCENDKIFAKGMCNKHYTQMNRYGKILERTARDPNKIILEENFAYICLYDKNCKEIGRCIIDIEDVDKIKNYKWHIKYERNKEPYCRNNKIGVIHRFLLNLETGDKRVVDHINHNPLDNRKDNLRICTNKENVCNSKIAKTNKSGVKGVYWDVDRNKWSAQIRVDNKTKALGRFTNMEDAIKVRKEAEELYQGEFKYNVEEDTFNNKR